MSPIKRRWHLVAHSLDVAMRRPAVARAAVVAVLAVTVLASVDTVAGFVGRAHNHKALNAAAAALRRETTTANTLARSLAVQDRGLQANCHLVAAIGDIGQLLTFRQDRSRVPPRVLSLLVSLQAESTEYAQIESAQPNARAC